MENEKRHSQEVKTEKMRNQELKGKRKGRVNLRRLKCNQELTEQRVRCVD